MNQCANYSKYAKQYATQLKERVFFVRLLFVVIALMLAVALPARPSENSLEIYVHNLKSNQGYLMVALHNSPKTFLKENTIPFARRRLKVTGRSSRLKFTGLPAGVYSVTIFQDLNANKELDTNLLGIPQEPFGFSRNPKVRLGPPSFSATSFQMQNSQKMSIGMQD